MGVGVGVTLLTALPRMAHPQWSVGVSAGPTYNWMQGIAVEDQDPVWGYLVGGFFTYRFDRRWAVRVEGNAVRKGADNVALESGDTLSSVSLTYLDFPILLNLVTRLGRRTDLGLYGGAAVGFTMTCFYSIGTAQASKCERSPLGDVNMIVWTMPVGAEFRWNLPSLNSSFMLDGRFTLGIGFPFETGTARNHSFAVLARWQYSLVNRQP